MCGTRGALGTTVTAFTLAQPGRGPTYGPRAVETGGQGGPQVAQSSRASAWAVPLESRLVGACLEPPTRRAFVQPGRSSRGSAGSGAVGLLTGPAVVWLMGALSSGSNVWTPNLETVSGDAVSQQCHRRVPLSPQST